ncbi:hypothetical protein H7142_01120 [Candidatus Saccharibacteria bacterium]|nr:hypothetical protein [Candidatus Saccharibacteria bacterium]
MSEHISDSSAEREISPSEKLGLVQRVRKLAPFDTDRINKVDRLGSYETCFIYGEEGYVSIYVPGLAGIGIEGELIDTAVRVCKRIPDELENGMTVVTTTSYIIDELTLDARYVEDEHVFDTVTGKRIGPKLTDDPGRLMELASMEYEFRVSPVFTEARLAEVNEVLDSLDPEDTLKY